MEKSKYYLCYYITCITSVIPSSIYTFFGNFVVNTFYHWNSIINLDISFEFHHSFRTTQNKLG